MIRVLERGRNHGPYSSHQPRRGIPRSSRDLREALARQTGKRSKSPGPAAGNAEELPGLLLERRTVPGAQAVRTHLHSRVAHQRVSLLHAASRCVVEEGRSYGGRLGGSDGRGLFAVQRKGAGSARLCREAHTQSAFGFRWGLPTAESAFLRCRDCGHPPAYWPGKSDQSLYRSARTRAGISGRENLIAAALGEDFTRVSHPLRDPFAIQIFQQRDGIFSANSGEQLELRNINLG